MNGIRTFLIVVAVAALALFAVGNSFFVRVNLGFRQLDIWLPLLVFAAFLIGFLPVWAWLAADRMRLRRKVAKLEAGLARSEADLAQARVELLRPPAPAAEIRPPAAGTES